MGHTAAETSPYFMMQGFPSSDWPSVKFFVDNWILLTVAFTSGAMLVWPVVRGGRGGSIGTAEAVRLINREKGVLIDVCEPAEFAAGHAIGARNVPLGSLETSKSLPSNKALPIIVLCATGTRSSRAVAALTKLGYQNVQAISGGNAAWREATLPMEKA
jgi:rhodanese-related sulfurtransferase